MTRRERQCRGNLSTSLLHATVPSDEVGSSSDYENRANKENKNILFGNGLVVLGLATSHFRKWSRYVTKASLRHITMERQCLRWWMTARPCIHPLLEMTWTPIWKSSEKPKGYRHQWWKTIIANSASKLEVLHLFRCSTHTPRCREAF